MSNGNKNKKCSLEQYLEEIRPYSKDKTIVGKLKLCLDYKHAGKESESHSKCKNIEVIAGNITIEIFNEIYGSLVSI